MKLIQRRFAAASLVLVLGAAGAVRADTTLPVDLPTMTGRAELIFSGTCTNAAKETKGGFKVVTYTFTVKDVMKGNLAAGQSIGVSKWIGERGAPYEVGKDYVLFLLPEGKNGLRATVGNYYGSFAVTRLTDGKATVMNARGNRNLFPAGAAASPAAMKAMSVGGVKAVKAAADAPVEYTSFVDMVNVLKTDAAEKAKAGKN